MTARIYTKEPVLASAQINKDIYIVMRRSMQKYNLLDLSKPKECIFSFVDNFPIPNSAKKGSGGKQRCIYNSYDMGNVEAALFLNIQDTDASLVIGTNRGIVIRALLSNAAIKNEIHLPTAPVLQLKLAEQFNLIVAITPSGAYIISTKTMDIIKQINLIQTQRFYPTSTFYCNIDLKIQEQLFNQEVSKAIGLIQAKNHIYILLKSNATSQTAQKIIGQNKNSDQRVDDYEIKLLFENNFYRATLISSLNLILAINRFGCLSVYGLNGRYMGRFHCQEKIIDFKLRPSGIVLAYTLSDRIFQVSFSILHGLRRVHFTQVLGAYPFIDFDVPASYTDVYLTTQQQENTQNQVSESSLNDSIQQKDNSTNSKPAKKENKQLQSAKNKQLFQYNWQRETEMGISGIMTNSNDTNQGKDTTTKLNYDNFEWKMIDYIISSNQGIQEGLFYLIQRCNSIALIATNNLTELDATAFTGRSGDKFLMNQTATANILATQSAYVIPQNDYIIEQRYLLSRLKINKIGNQPHNQSSQDNTPDVEGSKHDQDTHSNDDTEDSSSFSNDSSDYENDTQYQQSKIQVLDKRNSRIPDKNTVLIVSDSETVHGLLNDYLSSFSKEYADSHQENGQILSDTCKWPPNPGQSQFNEMFSCYKKKYQSLHEILQDIKNDCMAVQKKSLVKITAGASGAGSVAGMHASGMNDTDMQCKLVYSPESIKNNEQFQTLFVDGCQHLDNIFQAYISECDKLCPDTLGNPWELGVIKQDILDNNDLRNKYKLHVSIKSNPILLTRRQLQAYMQRCDLNDLLKARAKDFEALKNNLTYSRTRDKLYIESGIGVSLGREMIYALSFIDYFTPENFGHTKGQNSLSNKQSTEYEDLLMPEFYEDVEETSESEILTNNENESYVTNKFSVSSADSYVVEEMIEKEDIEYDSQLATSTTPESPMDNENSEQFIDLSKIQYIDDDIENPAIQKAVEYFVENSVVSVGIEKYKKSMTEQKKKQRLLILQQKNETEKQQQQKLPEINKSKQKEVKDHQQSIKKSEDKKALKQQEHKTEKHAQSKKHTNKHEPIDIENEPQPVQTQQQETSNQNDAKDTTEKSKKFSFIKKTKKDKQQDKPQDTQQQLSENPTQTSQSQKTSKKKDQNTSQKESIQENVQQSLKTEKDVSDSNNQKQEQPEKKGLFSKLKKKSQIAVQPQKQEQLIQESVVMQAKPKNKGKNIFDSEESDDKSSEQNKKPQINSKQMKNINEAIMSQKEEGLAQSKKQNVFQSSSSENDEESSESASQNKKNLFESDNSENNSNNTENSSEHKTQQQTRSVDLKQIEQELQSSDYSVSSEDIQALRQQLQKQQDSEQNSSVEQDASDNTSKDSNNSKETQKQTTQTESPSVQKTKEQSESNKSSVKISFSSHSTQDEVGQQTYSISDILSKEDSDNMSKSLSFYKDFPQTSSFSECHADLLEKIQDQLNPLLLTQDELDNILQNEKQSMISVFDDDSPINRIYYRISDVYEQVSTQGQEILQYKLSNADLYSGSQILHLLRAAAVSYGILQAQKIRQFYMSQINELRQNLHSVVFKQFPSSITLENRFILLFQQNYSDLEWNTLFEVYDMYRHVRCVGKRIPLNIASKSYERSFSALKYDMILGYLGYARSGLNHVFVLTKSPETFSLFELLQDSHQSVFSTYFKDYEDVMYFVTGLLLTVSYLNSGPNKLMHRDLRPSTIWVKETESGPVPLIHHIGFMSPTLAVEKDEMNTFWAAPEVICGSAKEVSDVWSIGTIAYKLALTLSCQKQVQKHEKEMKALQNQLQEIQKAKESETDVEETSENESNKVETLNEQILNIQNQINQISQVRNISLFGYNKKLLNETTKKQQYINISCIIQMVRASLDVKKIYVDGPAKDKLNYYIYNEQIARQMAEQTMMKDIEAFLFTSEKQYLEKSTVIVESIKSDAMQYDYLQILKQNDVPEYILCFIQTCWTFDIFQRLKATALLNGQFNYNIESKYVNKKNLLELKMQLSQCLSRYDQVVVQQALNKASFQIDLNKEEYSSEQSQEIEDKSKSESENPESSNVQPPSYESSEVYESSSEVESSTDTSS